MIWDYVYRLFGIRNSENTRNTIGLKLPRLSDLISLDACRSKFMLHLTGNQERSHFKNVWREFHTLRRIYRLLKSLPVVLINPRYIRHALGRTSLRYLMDTARKAATEDLLTSGNDQGIRKGKRRRELFNCSPHVCTGREHSFREVAFATNMFVPEHNQFAPVKVRFAGCPSPRFA